ncbi:hypothetical protein AKN87_01710 [Thiopseudomonas alkaliphila]|uniref:Uncharacterized protein n=1 Tax=Thiopseudomonas alkaliphila TaxID=1697053 RepID=A0A0K1XGI4_9GAMM|nr:hypothetical protein [Thiopseudomonas alkaliphila]AKX43967.1 hypothetical protein AKN87_01710 [Thiopseudomonas alkaliphila]AKX46223.1 hypothetical protein AKN94_01685 [Thiopseudomonas alkaliphila]AKX60451.1 hypothetical protein AKN88_11320 [Thiopseudomonas alkaliphila]
MKRKNVIEYALGYANNYIFMCSAYQLMSEWKVAEEDQKHLDKCHIYIIATRPKPYFVSHSLKYADGKLSGKIGYKIKGAEYFIDFDHMPFELADDAIEFKCEYPFQEIWTYNAAGERVRYYPVTHIASFIKSLNRDLSFRPSDDVMSKFEVLYIGQAIGRGDRSAQQRLNSHSTFQKIITRSAHETPDNEIIIFMLQFEDDQVFTTMDGQANDEVKSRDKSDVKRLMETIYNPPSKKQKIALIEAGLIRYFQPHYNEIFKIKFPSTKHKVLKSCEKLDVSALLVSLNTSDFGFTLWSPAVAASDNHIAKFDLVNLQDRMSFFSLTNMPEFPGVIKTES